MIFESAVKHSRNGNTCLHRHLAFSLLASPFSIRALVTIDSKPAAPVMILRVQFTKMGPNVRGSKMANAVCFISHKLYPN